MLSVALGVGFSLLRRSPPTSARADAFASWLQRDRSNRPDFAEFRAFLARNEVSGVVPDWQLLRTDAPTAGVCNRPPFLLPPRERWPAIVPVLKLIKRNIAPQLGRLEAVSAYRTTDFNGCVGGAKLSQHLGFAALDLVAIDQTDNKAVFARLCSIHRAIGWAAHFGLGAYFDTAHPDKNRRARFHVDVAGFRSWGFSKHAESSGCLALSTIGQS